MRQAKYYEKIDDGPTVKCTLCPHGCVIKSGRMGICKVRRNDDGVLMSLNYGKAIALHHDPIEKKPLFHVLPGSITTSIATVGCNMTCTHCQNHDISQYPVRFGECPGTHTTPEKVVEQAKAVGASTIAFTYTEPTIFMEWALDVAQYAVENGLRCVSVTNGYVNEKPLRDLAANLLAANVDLKAFDPRFYKMTCGASLDPVKDTIVLLHELGVWVEVTTLLIPGLNDQAEQLVAMAEFIASIDLAIPWHLSRFHPANQMTDLPATPVDSIQRARNIGQQAGLEFVYSGNVWGHEGENTICPGCGKTIIQRHGYSIVTNHLMPGGKCPFCEKLVKGAWA